MRMGRLILVAGLVFAAGAQAQPAAPAAPAPPGNAAQQIFNGTCASCHGADLAGGRGPSLFAPAFLAAQSDETILATIQAGRPDAGMPGFKDQYTEEQLRQVVTYLRIRGGQLRDRPVFVPDPNNQIIKSQKQTFKIEVVAAGLDTPWGMTFLPDGRMLVTERSGHLRIIDHGKLLPDPVKGIPVPFVRQDGGTLDVALHPDYRRNGWIYLSYSEVVPGTIPAPGSNTAPNPAPPTMTVLVRGKLNRRNEWTQEQLIFRAPPALYTTTSDHYGSRFLFDKEGHLFYSLGERHNMKNAQDLSVPMGKIHRVNDDGTPAAGNPFINTPGADPTVWSLGHRNPEGLAFDPVSGLLWESEHGPTGGDEINIIEKGHNYGWGVVTMGLEPGLTHQHEAGMDDPIAFYTPTIAPSGMTFYSGNRYPGWKNNLFVAALAGQQLLRFEIDGRRIVAQEPLFQQYGRVRDVITGPDGLLYILLQNPTGAGTGLSLSAPTAGMVVRLSPVP